MVTLKSPWLIVNSQKAFPVSRLEAYAALLLLEVRGDSLM
jgi:hypothetical protein